MFKSIQSKAIIIGLLAIMGLSAIGFTYFKGYSSGKNDCKTEQLQTELKGIQVHEEIEKSVMQIKSSDLDYSLSKWMRDD